MLYRTEHPLEPLDGYLEWVPEWERRLEFTRSGARRALRAALALRHRGGFAGTGRRLGVILFGPRAEIRRARAAVAAAARRASAPGDADALREPFRDFWRQSSRLGTLEGLAETNPPPAEPPAAQPHLDLTESWAGRAIGLHDLENIDGEARFRWTAPLALLRVVVPGPGRRRARLELRPFERPVDARPADPRVAVDNRRVPILLSDEAIEFEIGPGGHWIALACNPLRPQQHGVDDPRALGLPVRTLGFEPSGPQTGR